MDLGSSLKGVFFGEDEFSSGFESCSGTPNSKLEERATPVGKGMRYALGEWRVDGFLL